MWRIRCTARAVLRTKGQCLAHSEVQTFESIGWLLRVLLRVHYTKFVKRFDLNYRKPFIAFMLAVSRNSREGNRGQIPGRESWTPYRAGGRARRASGAGERASGRASEREVGPYGRALTCCGGAELPSDPAGAGGVTCAPVSEVITVTRARVASQAGWLTAACGARTRDLLPASSGALPCANVMLPRERCSAARVRAC